MVVRKILRVYNFMSTDPEGKQHSSWIIEYQEGDVQRAVGFPTEVLSYRSAEYGIPYGDTDTLLELVMHEHMFSVPRNHPKHLYNTDEETGRLHQLSLLQVSKMNYQYQDPDGLLEQIRQEHLRRHDPVDHARKIRNARELRSKSMRAMGGVS